MNRLNRFLEKENSPLIINSTRMKRYVVVLKQELTYLCCSQVICSTGNEKNSINDVCTLMYHLLSQRT